MIKVPSKYLTHLVSELFEEEKLLQEVLQVATQWAESAGGAILVRRSQGIQLGASYRLELALCDPLLRLCQSSLPRRGETVREKLQGHDLLCLPLNTPTDSQGWLCLIQPGREFATGEWEELQPLLNLVAITIERHRMQEELQQCQPLPSAWTATWDPAEETPTFRALLRRGLSFANQELLLLVGETGTEKELLARRLHDSRFPGGTFSAFSGNAQGFVTAARRAEAPSALYLDCVEELTGGELRDLRRVLGRLRAGVQVCLGATPYLELLVRARKFPSDLYHHWSGTQLKVPALRERASEILPLADNYLKRYAEKEQRSLRGFDRTASEALRRYSWPNNLKELEYEVARGVALAKDDLVRLQDLSLTLRADFATAGPDEVEKHQLIQHLERNHWNVSLTARLLGWPRRTIYNKIEKYGIKRPRWA